MKDKKRKAWLYKVDNEFIEELQGKDMSDVLENIDMEVNLSISMKPYEPQDHFYRYFFYATYCDYADDDEIMEDPKTIKIAFAEAVIFDVDASEYRLIDMCDADSGDYLEAYVALYDDDEMLLPPLEDNDLSPVCYLQEFMVHDQFLPIQAELLNWIIKYLSNFSPVVVTLPVPTHMSEGNENCIGSITRDFDDDNTLKLRRFFTSQGFFPLRDTDYMYHIFDYSLE